MRSVKQKATNYRWQIEALVRNLMRKKITKSKLPLLGTPKKEELRLVGDKMHCLILGELMRNIA